MGADRSDAVSELLVETMEAHGRYEETELNGIYDQEWPRWYAAYAVEHGIGKLLGHDVTTDQLATFLATSNVEFERSEPKASEPWAAYTARRIAADL